MNKVRAHIDELETLMKANGFDGHFLSNSNHPGKLKDSLYAHLLETPQGQKNVPPFFLTTYSHWKDEERPYVKCDFKMKYDSWLGFKVDKITVTRANHFGVIKRVEVTPNNNQEIPTREKVNELVGQKKRSLKI
jgi:hypothetical protein